MAGKEKRSLHVGSAMIDIICIVAAENIERMTFSNEGKAFLMVETGRKVPAESITTHVGGGACNTAVGLARRGWATAVLARTGDDLNAEAVAEHLEENGVATDRLVTAEGLATGTAVMVASHDRNASIFVHRGANETLEPGDLPDGVFAGMDLVYVAPLSSGSADCLPGLVARAKEAGAVVAVNPGIRQLSKRTGDILSTLAHMDLISVNRVEAEALVPALISAQSGRHGEDDGTPVPDDAPELMRRGLEFGGQEFGGVKMSLPAFMAAMHALGPTWVLVTDGIDGAYLGTPDGIYWRAALPVTVQGTAGAGDSYTSTLTAALVEGAAPEDAMLEAAMNAASVVGALDTTSGLLGPDALDERRRDLGEVALRRF